MVSLLERRPVWVVVESVENVQLIRAVVLLCDLKEKKKKHKTWYA